MVGWQNVKIFQDPTSISLSCRDSVPTCYCFADHILCIGYADGALQFINLRDEEQNVIFPSIFSRCVARISYSRNKRLIVCIGMEKNDENLYVKLSSFDNRLFLLSTHEPLAHGHTQKPPIIREIKLCWSQLLLDEQYDETSSRIFSLTVTPELSAVGIRFHNSVAVFTGTFEHIFDRPYHIKSRADKGKITLILFCDLSKSPKKGLFISEEPGRQLTQLSGFGTISSLHTSNDFFPIPFYTVYEDSVSVWWPHTHEEYTEMVCPVPFGGADGCAAALGDYGGLAIVHKGNSSWQLAIIGNRSGIPFDPTSPSSVKVITLDLPRGRLLRQVECLKDYIWLVSQKNDTPDTYFLHCVDYVHHICCLGSSQPRFNNCECALMSSDGFVIMTASPHAKEQKERTNFLQFHAHLIKEQPLMIKLGLYLEKELFDIAKELAAEVSGMPADEDHHLVTVVSKLYGDYLYSKGLAEKAMDEYLDTIGFQEPSYVIVRYLKSKHLPDLTRYLEKLVSPRFEKYFPPWEFLSHAKLLLHCYMKQGLHDRSKHLVAASSSKTITPEFVAQTLEEAGCYAVAREIAQKYNMFLHCFQIAFFDLQDLKSALDYLHFIPLTNSLEIISRYAREAAYTNPLLHAQFLVNLSLFWRNPTSGCAVLKKGVQQAALLHSASALADHPLYFRCVLQSLYQNRVLDPILQQSRAEEISGRLLFSYLFLLANKHGLEDQYFMQGDTKKGRFFPSQHYPSGTYKDFLAEDSLSSRREKALSIIRSRLDQGTPYLLLLLCHIAEYTEGIECISPLLEEEPLKNRCPSSGVSKVTSLMHDSDSMYEMALKYSSPVPTIATSLFFQLGSKHRFQLSKRENKTTEPAPNKEMKKFFCVPKSNSTETSQKVSAACRSVW